MKDFYPEKDLSKASTIPSHWYLDAQFLEWERDKIFWSTWQPVGRADLVVRPGDYVTAEVLGEPLVVTRGVDGLLRAFSNVCRHRAAPVRDRRFIRTEPESRALYYWIFPNFMINIYPDNLQANIILPLGHDRTLTVFEWFFVEPGSGEGWESLQQSIAFSDQVQKEDIEICENVQRGLRSRTYSQGRFSAKRENGVHHFHLLLHEFLTR